MILPWSTLRLPTSGQTEPVTREDVAWRCRIDCPDENLDGIITAARIACEKILRGTIVKQEYRSLYRQNDRVKGSLLKLAHPPQLSVESVQVAGDTNPLDPSQYRFVADSFLSGAVEILSGQISGEIEVQYTAGYASPADVPEDIKTAIYMLCSHIYEQYNATSDVQLSEIPFGVKAILSKYQELIYY